MIGMYAFAYPNMIVEHYTAERGLPNNIVNCTLKGQDGFIWFGTWYGLCSFDGSKFRSYDNHDCRKGITFREWIWQFLSPD